jgi:hypothetical protein
MPPMHLTQGSPADVIDRAVDDVQKSLLRNVSVPPIAIAHGSTCVFLQKYLESFALAALIMLAPMPPAPTALVRHWAEVARALDSVAAASGAAAGRGRGAGSEEQEQEGEGQGIDMSPEGIAKSLRAFTRSAEAARACLHTSATPMSAVQAAWSRSYSPSSSPSSSSSSALESAAALISATCKEPVNLEPSPVHMLVVASAYDRLLPYAHLLDTASFHGLQHSLPARLPVAAEGTAPGAAAPASSLLAKIPSPAEQVANGNNVVLLTDPTIGHDCGLFTADSAAPVVTALEQWIDRRF